MFPHQPFQDPRFLKARKELEEALACQQKGMLADAERKFSRLLKKNPEYFDALHFYGLLLLQIGRLPEALKLISKASKINPRSANALNSRGVVLGKVSRHADAISAFDAALQIDPAHASALCNRANSLNALERFDEALVESARAIAINPRLADAYIPQGAALAKLERYAEALMSYGKAANLNPLLLAAAAGAGTALLKLRRFDEALRAYDRVISLDPNDADAWTGRGNVLEEFKRLDDALAAHDKAIALRPDMENAWLGRGNALLALDRYDEALAAFKRATEIKPDFADAYWCIALAMLSRGEFAEGWNLYEWRSQRRENRQILMRDNIYNLSARQSRDDLTGKQVLVLSEQGIGDEIMFASMLPDLMKDAKSIVYEVDRRLVNLVSDSFPAATVVAKGDRDGLEMLYADVVIQAGSLGYAYRRAASSFPKSPYLRAAPDRIDRWLTRLSEEARGRTKIGISWRGGIEKTRRSERSIDLAAMRPLLTRDDCYFVNLQYGNVSGEISSFNAAHAEHHVHCPLNNIDDFDEFAALISSLDLVISVQNATVHMCGALGKACWGMLPWRPEWRYGTNGPDMIWYPSVKLYRQAVPGDWDSLMSSVTRDLDEFMRAWKTAPTN